MTKSIQLFLIGLLSLFVIESACADITREPQQEIPVPAAQAPAASVADRQNPLYLPPTQTPAPLAHGEPLPPMEARMAEAMRRLAEMSDQMDAAMRRQVQEQNALMREMQKQMQQQHQQRRQADPNAVDPSESMTVDDLFNYMWNSMRDYSNSRPRIPDPAPAPAPGLAPSPQRNPSSLQSRVQGPSTSTTIRSSTPKMQTVQKEDAMEIRIPLPENSSADVKTQIANGYLIIKITLSQTQSSGGAGASFSFTQYNSTREVVPLSDDLDTANMLISTEDGYYVITIPRLKAPGSNIEATSPASNEPTPDQKQASTPLGP